MPTMVSNAVSRKISSKEKKQSGEARPYQVRYRITWPDDLLKRRQDDPLTEAFVLKRLRCDIQNKEVEDRTYQPTLYAMLDLAQTAADIDCGQFLTWS